MGRARRERKLKIKAIREKDERLRFHGKGGPLGPPGAAGARGAAGVLQKGRAAAGAGPEPAPGQETPGYAPGAFFEYNPSLGPPYSVLVDTSFLNFCVRTKQDLITGMVDCLYAKAVPYVTDCVMAELERHGREFGIALRLAKDPRVRRLTCDHARLGYADDCLCHRAEASRCYIVATNDAELKRRVRKIPGVPIMSVRQGKFVVEKLGDALVV